MVVDKLICCALILAAFTGCEDRYGAPSDTQRELEEFKDGISELMKHTDQPMAEVKKLREWEYLVTSIPLEQGQTDYERTLNRLGKDRWDCFDIHQVTEPRPALMIFCKRPPDTPLHFVPRAIMDR